MGYLSKLDDQLARDQLARLQLARAGSTWASRLEQLACAAAISESI